MQLNCCIITKTTNLLEIGCGAGAFLYALQKHIQCPITGIDYSKNLIAIAQRFLPQGSFEVAEASEIAFPNNSFDCALVHGIMHYFPTVEYATTMLEKAYLALKPNSYLGLLEVNNSDSESIYHDERQKLYPDPELYCAKYKEYPHIFYNKQKLQQTLENIEFSNVTFFPHAVKNYPTAHFRFNLFAQKISA